MVDISFNPSIGLTSVPTLDGVQPVRFSAGFNPSIGLTSVPTRHQNATTRIGLGFNPSIGLTSVPTDERAYVEDAKDFVSIPQSGLQAFRRESFRREL